MSVRPLYDRILIKRVEAEEKTASGIIIPDSAKEKPQQGIVVSVGPGKRGEDGEFLGVDVSEGDRILFGKYAGNEITIGGNDHMILREDEILGVLAD